MAFHEYENIQSIQAPHFQPLLSWTHYIIAISQYFSASTDTFFPLSSLIFCAFIWILRYYLSIETFTKWNTLGSAVKKTLGLPIKYYVSVWVWVLNPLLIPSSDYSHSDWQYVVQVQVKSLDITCKASMWREESKLNMVLWPRQWHGNQFPGFSFCHISLMQSGETWNWKSQRYK